MSDSIAFCKAYRIEMLRAFQGFEIDPERTRPELDADGYPLEGTNRKLDDSDIVYLQPDYSVTDGIELDINTIYRNASPEWISFCKEKLLYSLPQDAVRNVAPPKSQA